LRAQRLRCVTVLEVTTSTPSARDLITERIVFAATPDPDHCETCATPLVEGESGLLSSDIGRSWPPGMCEAGSHHVRGWVDEDSVLTWALALAALPPEAAASATPGAGLETLLRLEADEPGRDALELVEVTLALLE
jgi:hypothetical protein